MQKTKQLTKGGQGKSSEFYLSDNEACQGQVVLRVVLNKHGLNKLALHLYIHQGHMERT